jgi:Fe-S oxidoreductase
VHVTELLLDLLEAGKLELGGPYGRRVAYHDPCYLGRHNGVYESPREVLRSVPGLELVELPESRAESLCCGGGGGRIWMETAKGERFCDLRVGQAMETGAAVLATACPYCISNFEDSKLTLDAVEEIEVRDITEIVSEALGGK